MSTDVICPDCGGVIGGIGDGSRPRCQCSSGATPDDTGAITVDAGPRKVCVQCGKDVTGQKRAKDSRGYWCYDCHKADMAREKAAAKPRVRCPDCGRGVPADSLVNYDGIPICIKCRDDRAELAKHRKKFRAKVGDNFHGKEEKRKLMMLLGILGLLVLVIVLNIFHLMPRFF